MNYAFLLPSWRRFAGVLAAGALSLTALASQAGAEGVVDLCMKNGVTVHAARVEVQGGGYVITPPGGGAPPFTIPADQVSEVGVACAANSRQEPKAPSSFQGADEPRFGVYGAEAIGARLMPLLIDAYAKRRGWSATAKASGPDSQEVTLSAEGAARPSAVIELKVTDSAAGFAGLVEGSAAIAMSSRRAAPQEAARLKARFGVDVLLPSSGAEHVVALDALAVIVHRDNPIKRLKPQQIVEIFSGRLTNWRDVRGWNDDGEWISGPASPIRVHALDERSESFAFFKSLALDPVNVALIADARRHGDSKSLTRAVGKDESAIGFVEFPYISKNDALSIGMTCTLLASRDRVSSGSFLPSRFPMRRRPWFVTPGSSIRRSSTRT
jgi:phosphate transport system substrate-binding protein